MTIPDRELLSDSLERVFAGMTSAMVGLDFAAGEHKKLSDEGREFSVAYCLDTVARDRYLGQLDDEAQYAAAQLLWRRFRSIYDGLRRDEHHERHDVVRALSKAA